MIKNHLGTLMIFLSQLKNFMQKRQAHKSAIAELFSKTYTKKKISNERFHHCQANIFLEEVIKSINSQTNFKSSDRDSLTANIYKRVSYELSPIL